MKVAVSALTPSLDSQVDEHFGRAAYLLIVDIDTLEFQPIDNSANKHALQGAGLGAAEAVGNAGVDAVITGHLGPKAFRALSAIEIDGYSGVGMSVRDAVNRYAVDGLDRLDDSVAHQRFE